MKVSQDVLIKQNPRVMPSMECVINCKITEEIRSLKIICNTNKREVICLCAYLLSNTQTAAVVHPAEGARNEE